MSVIVEKILVKNNLLIFDDNQILCVAPPTDAVIEILTNGMSNLTNGLRTMSHKENIFFEFMKDNYTQNTCDAFKQLCVEDQQLLGGVDFKNNGDFKRTILLNHQCTLFGRLSTHGIQLLEYGFCGTEWSFDKIVGAEFDLLDDGNIVNFSDEDTKHLKSVGLLNNKSFKSPEFNLISRVVVLRTKLTESGQH